MLKPLSLPLSVSQSVKALMAEKKIPVNAQTFCGVALACSRQKHGLQLLSDMEVRLLHLIGCT